MGQLVLLLVPEFIGLLITPAAIALCAAAAIAQLGAQRTEFGGAFLLIYAQIALAALLGGATGRAATSHTLSHWVGLAVGLLLLAVGAWLLTRSASPEGTTPKWMAVALANDSVYGLSATVWTGDLARAHR